MWLIISGHECGASTGQQVFATFKIAVTREEDPKKTVRHCLASSKLFIHLYSAAHEL